MPATDYWVCFELGFGSDVLAWQTIPVHLPVYDRTYAVLGERIYYYYGGRGCFLNIDPKWAGINVTNTHLDRGFSAYLTLAI